MRPCGFFAMRSAALLGIALAILLPCPGAAATSVDKHAAPQVVLLLSGRSLLERRLPAFIGARPGQYLSASTLQRACGTPMLRVDSVLLFLPASQQCEHIAAQDQVWLRQLLQQLTGRWPTDDVLVRLREQPFLAIAPAPPRITNPGCTCPNTPPNGVAMCGAQTQTGGTPISTVEYLATDADGDSLTGTFSYQFDADPVQSGLPPPLTSMCTPAPGTLQCTIDGNAPAQAGILQLMLTVSDGISMPDLQLTSLLQVIAASDRIFVNGFEDATMSSCSVLP